MLLLNGVRAAQADQEGREALLSVQYHGQCVDSCCIGEFVVSPALACILKELVHLPFVTILRLQFPKKERADGVAAHYRVKQLHDLIRLPDELTLNRRKEVLMRLIAIPMDSDR